MGGQKAFVSLLEYSSICCRWQGEQELPEGGILLIWMDMVTFLRYLDAHLASHGIEHPTVEQRQAGIDSCRQFSYWLHITTTIVDENVHIRRLGGLHPGDYHVSTAK
ncbi:MAG: hypothetical protein H0V70_30235 [Ktedonobacteraceae bacterium]|nr:hypothetical protein [Ktedonobacteraceae bacterium]